MFDLLKNKIKSFTDKVFGKAKEKEIIQEEIIEDKKPITEFFEEPEIKKEITEEMDLKTNKDQIQQAEEIPDINKTNSQQVLDDDLLEVSTGDVDNSNNLIKENIKDFDTLESSRSEPSLEYPQNNKDIEPLLEDNIKQPENFISTKNIKSKETVIDLKKSKPKEEIDKINLDKISSDSKKDLLDEKTIFPSKIEKSEDSNLNIKKSTEVKKSLFTSIKSIFVNKIKLSEKEISDFLDEFEFSLLEADVSLKSAQAIVDGLKQKLTNCSFSKENTLEDIREQIKIVLKEELDIDCDIENYFNNKKKEDQPFIILFIGTNGAGKTTTISKLANKLKLENKSVILASSDTFRAGSIDQLEKHASNIGVRIVKQTYGSDPAAVAYDAVSAAKANNVNFVLIDTAGRQETNFNLMQELKKIKRVVNPNLIIYIGEAQSGQAITEQIQKFDLEIGIDGVILTKIDTDPKGGVAISILNEFKKPIFYIGTGQEYKDLEKFSPNYIIDRIV
ncbi:MAG: signal recognition particle-docking protein FtsY [Candidatus ainarchaeum sp.]|nr:signal recognition particle-docking protein FtsY [Candidatus ainarchaeum sp.]